MANTPVPCKVVEEIIVSDEIKNKAPQQLRIIMLTRWQPWLIQAVNRLHREVGLDAVYFEEGEKRNKFIYLPEIILNVGRLLIRLWALLKNKYNIKQFIKPSCTHKTARRKYMKKVYDELFIDPWYQIADPSLPVFTVEEKGFNSKDIKLRNPAILIVFGTSILPPKIIEIPSKICLNLHSGLSPYYRGTHCSDWAIIKEDIQNIGVTIHLLDPGIDTGPILAQDRPEILATDTPYSIDMKLCVLGIDLIIKIILQLIMGKCLNARPQVRSIGKTYYMKHWTSKAERILASRLKRGRVNTLLKKEMDLSRKIPIVRLSEVSCEGNEKGILMGLPFPQANELKSKNKDIVSDNL